jgi:hypothetical protein
MRTYLPCRKDYKIWYFSNGKKNACILIHPISDYNFFGEIISKYPILLIMAKKIGKKIAIQKTL